MDGKPQRRRIEREFGVPIAGEILDAACWTQTALKTWPEGERLDCTALFGRKAPLIVDIGCGNGRYLIQSAVWRQELDHLGVDPLPVVIRYATRRGNQRGLTNLRFGVADGNRLFESYLEPNSVREIHCYHPQPYYDPAQVGRRLITPRFLARVWETLEPGGEFYLQSDHPGYWRYIRDVVSCFFDFEERPGKWLDAPRGRTRREIIALKRGLPVFRGVGRPRLGISSEQVQRLAETLPPPVFEADRRLLALDEEERLADNTG